MDKIFLLPICLVIIGILYQVFKSHPWVAPGLVALSIALFPSIFWAIRNLGPFYGGADIGAGLLLIGSSVLLLPIVVIAFIKTKDWGIRKALKSSAIILGLNLSVSGANHFILVNQQKAFIQKSILDCKVMPYHCMVRDGKIDEIENLRNSGHDVESKDGWGRTALYFAYYSPGKEEFIKKLISVGADPGVVDNAGYPIVHHFIFNDPKNFDLANLLFQSGFDINTLYGEGKKTTLLNSSVVRKDTENIDYLLSKGANPLLKDGFGYSACERMKVHSVDGALKLQQLCN